MIYYQRYDDMLMRVSHYLTKQLLKHLRSELWDTDYILSLLDAIHLCAERLK